MMKEYIWGCELSAENKEYVWDLGDDLENDMTCTLLLKQAMLGTSGPTNDVNVVALDTFGISESISQPLFRLTDGKTEQCQLDILIAHPGTRLSLVQGSGPVYLWGQQLFEYPDEEDSDKEESGMAEDAEAEEEVDDDDDEAVEEDEELLKDELELLNGDNAKLDAAEKLAPPVEKSKKRSASVSNERAKKRVA